MTRMSHNSSLDRSTALLYNTKSGMFLAFSVMNLLASEKGLRPPKQPIFHHYFEIFTLLRMNQSQADNSVLAFHLSWPFILLLLLLLYCTFIAK